MFCLPSTIIIVATQNVEERLKAAQGECIQFFSAAHPHDSCMTHLLPNVDQKALSVLAEDQHLLSLVDLELRKPQE